MTMEAFRSSPSDPHRDYALDVELAEHAWLISLGWKYGASGGEFYWKAPASHRGSHTYYQSRRHAINSAHYYAEGLDRRRR